MVYLVVLRILFHFALLCTTSGIFLHVCYLGAFRYKVINSLHGVDVHVTNGHMVSLLSLQISTENMLGKGTLNFK